MFIKSLRPEYKTPAFLFCVGWCLVLLAVWIPILPQLQTFIYLWRVETAASILFSITLLYLLFRHREKVSSLSLSRPELNFIVFPLLAFIAWSALSIFWSASSNPALYHTLIWTEYLIFYLIARQILELPNGFKYLLTLLTGVIIIVALPAIVEYCSFLVLGGATSLGIRYAKYGELVITVFPLILTGVLRLRSRKFIGGIFIISLIGIFIISTLGRTNFIIFASEVLIIAGVVFINRNFYKYRRKLAICILGLIIITPSIHLFALFSDKPDIPTITRLTDIDDASIAYSGNFRKLMISVSLDIFLSHPFFGIGADNFGVQFNNYREIYAAKNPNNVNLTTAENEIAERSHNEYLQILAELGAIGGLIFLCFLSSVGMMFLNALKNYRRISLLQISALLGIVCFLASSLVSSYSFRLMQNGLVFFFVLAVAAKSLLKSNSVDKRVDEITVPAQRLKFCYALGIAACLLLAGDCLRRAASVYYAAEAQQQTNVDSAKHYYQTAFRLDSENPSPHFSYGMNLFNAGRFAEAAAQLKQSVKLGLAGSTDVS
ncbi:MAG: O-antigen ligase family protein [Pyrinomonadaceae bacterium]